MGWNGHIGRRALAAAFLLPLAACGVSGPPGQGDARHAVEARLEELRAQFLEGDTRAIPPDVAERLGGHDILRMRDSVRRAEMSSFEAGAFADAGDGRWKGRTSFEVAFPSPVPGAGMRFRVATEVTLVVSRGSWKFLAFGPLSVDRLASPLRT